MSGDSLHFVHGNGFPSPCYKRFLDILSKKYVCSYIDRVGHTPDFPVSENWEHLVDEVIKSIEMQCQTPTIGVGHSLGGVLTFNAAIKRPDLFKVIVLLDSPILGRIKSNILRLGKKSGLISSLTPALKTKLRKRAWNSRSEVLDYLKSKDLFKSFTQACLNDYVDFGMEMKNGKYTLRFNPDIEYQIYRTIPHNLYRMTKKLSVSAGLVYASQSHIVSEADIRHMTQKYNFKKVLIDGTHMFPMECPNEAANLTIELINALCASSG